MSGRISNCSAAAGRRDSMLIRRYPPAVFVFSRQLHHDKEASYSNDTMRLASPTSPIELPTMVQGDIIYPLNPLAMMHVGSMLYMRRVRKLTKRFPTREQIIRQRLTPVPKPQERKTCFRSLDRDVPHI